LGGSLGRGSFAGFGVLLGLLQLLLFLLELLGLLELFGFLLLEAVQDSLSLVVGNQVAHVPRQQSQALLHQALSLGLTLLPFLLFLRLLLLLLLSLSLLESAFKFLSGGSLTCFTADARAVVHLVDEGAYRAAPFGRALRLFGLLFDDLGLDLTVALVVGL